MRIMGLLRPHWKKVILFMVAIGVVAFIEGYFNYLNKQIIDEAIIPQNYERLWQIGWQYAGIWFFFAAFVFVFIYLAGRISQDVQYDLRKTMFGHLQDLSLSYYTKTPVG